MAIFRIFSTVSIGAVLISGSITENTNAATLTNAPSFNKISSYSTTITANNDPADIYFPNPDNLKTGNYSFPTALLLQGFNVDKSSYSNYARTVASYGFVVVVPNHVRPVPPPIQPIFGLTALIPETSQIDAVVSQIKSENTNPNSPIAGVINTQKLGLLGHSAGGAVGLSAIGNLCLEFLCEGSFSRPKELIAGAFFGANLRNQITQEFIPINNAGIPIALLQGNIDSIALPFRAEITYNNIKTPPKALINIAGVNHYGITNINNPAGPVPDSNAPTLPQDVAVETVARWSGLFLRASILGDQDAFNYVYSTGDELDANVSVISQAQPIPEASCTSGLMVLSAWGVLVGVRKRRQLKFIDKD